MRRPLFEIVEVKPIEVGDGPIDHAALMDQLTHDCPLCREALARGETPITGSGADLLEDRAPNWWMGRRRRRRGRR